MNLQLIIGWALKGSIMLTLFGFGLQTTLEDLFHLLRRPRLLVTSLASMFVVMPIFALFITRVGSFIPQVTIALIALSISPVPPILPKKIAKSGGLSEYGLGLMVTASVFSVVYIPLATYLIGRYFDRPFAMAPGAVVKLILISALIPLALGMVFRRFAPQAASRISGPLIRVAGIILLIGALCIVIFTFPRIWALVGNGTIIAFIIFGIVGLLVGHVLGGPVENERVTLALCTACRHPALALAIATANVPEQRNELSAILLYLVVNTLLTIPYVIWRRKKAKELAVRG